MQKAIQTNYTKLYSKKYLDTLLWLLQHYKHRVNLLSVEYLTGKREETEGLKLLGLIDWHKDWDGYTIFLTQLGKEVAIGYALQIGSDFVEYDVYEKKY